MTILASSQNTVNGPPDADRTGVGAAPQVLRRTKIIATLGPATDAPGVLDALVAAGVDTFRLNCSHGTRAEHEMRAYEVQTAAARHGRHVGVLVDIQGPKLRVGALDAPVSLSEGSLVSLAADTDAGPADIPVTFPITTVGVTAGARVLLADGRFELDTLDVDETRLVAAVRRGGELTSNKGVNLPDTDVALPIINDKDRADLEMATEIGADWVAVSFVGSAHHITAVRALIPPHIGIIAKIERPQAVDDFDAIAGAADAVMVARGDLGVETRYDQLPMLQKNLITRARRLGVPVVTATEMLESMVTSTRPTRAEAADVANAVLDGTDAVMLSAETAAGIDPVGAVKAMSAICAATEASPLHHTMDASQRPVSTTDPEVAALTYAAAHLARDLDIAAIVVASETGRTARLIAEDHPAAPVIGFSAQSSVCRRLALYWGIIPMLLPRSATTPALVDNVCQAVADRGLVRPGASVVVVAGAPNVTGSANQIHLRRAA